MSSSSLLPPPPAEGKLEEMVAELSQGLQVVKHEQEYMEVRERIHRMSESAWLLAVICCIVNQLLPVK